MKGVDVDGVGAMCDMDVSFSSTASKTKTLGRSRMVEGFARAPIADKFAGDTVKLKDMVKEYYKVFEKQSDKSYITYMLYALLNKGLDDKKSKELLEFINKHFEEIMEDSFTQYLMSKCISMATNCIGLGDIEKIFGSNYSPKLVQDFTIMVTEPKLTDIEVHKLVQKDSLDSSSIDKAIWTIVEIDSLDTIPEEI